MLKPMPYTPQPKADPIHPGLNAEEWEWDQFEEERTRQWIEENALDEKRLTDAECAAEYWRELRIATRNAYLPQVPLEEWQVSIEQAATWHRLATTPSIWEEHHE